MPTVTFKGRVLPSVVNISFQKLPSIQWEDTELGFKMSFTVTIENSNIRIDGDLDRYSDSFIASLHMRALDIARAVVDLACFASGFGATVILETLTKPDGSESQILPRDERLPPLCTSFKLGLAPNPDLDKMLQIVLTEPALFMALNDLIVSITLPHHSPVNCGRALDGIRNMIAPDQTTQQQWQAVRSNLNLSVDYLKLITDTSIAPRHGDRKRITGGVTTEISKRSWIIMDRFFEYRKRGNQPLPLNEFPVLS
jgi:hypothetical protein